RPQDAPFPRAARRGRRQRQRKDPALSRQADDQSRADPRDRPRRRLAEARPPRRHRALADRVLRRQAEADRQGRARGVGTDGRSERLDPESGAGCLPADVRRSGRGRGRDVRHVRIPGRGRERDPRAARSRPAGRGGAGVPLCRQGGHGPQLGDAGHLRRPGDVRGSARWRACDRAPRGNPPDGPALLPRLMDGLALLATLQLADSTFPSGAYTLSGGLETLLDEGLVDGPNGLAGCIRSVLLGRAARGDLAALIAAHRAASENPPDVRSILAIDRRLEATKLAAEERTGARRVGRRIAIEGDRLISSPAVAALV